MASRAELSQNMDTDKFYADLKEELGCFDGTGNILGIVPLTLAGYPSELDWKQDGKLREFLGKWGKRIGSDSVMVLTGDYRKADEQGYDFFMDVFEPNGGGEGKLNLAGGVSTMCGNGVRAVAAYLRELKPGINLVRLMTKSGLREIAIEGEMYVVQMGELATSASDLTSYVNTDIATPNSEGRFIDAVIPPSVVSCFGAPFTPKSWSIGLTGDRTGEKIDGEPHVIVEIPSSVCPDISSLREYAVRNGPAITKDSAVFPKEINANFVVVISPQEILLCTHERNLGNDPDHSVTAACGTGSTVAAGVIMEKYQLAGHFEAVKVHCPGGDLEIARTGKQMIMKGPAKRIQCQF